MIKQKKKLTLSLIEQRLHELPLLPAVVCDLMALNSESPHFYEKVGELSKSDPALATRVLHVVNSAAAAPSKPITDLQQALVRIGVNRILAFISLLSVARVFTPSTAQQKALWQHSIETAHFAEFIATKFPEFAVDKNLAFTCGLLHDIGRFVMFEISAKAIDVVDAKGWDTPVELPDVESSVLGFTHADVGFIAAKRWSLPKVVTDLVHHHHRYDIWALNKVPVGLKQLITVVQIADLLSVLVEKNPDWESWDESELRARIGSFCIHPKWPKMPVPIDEIAQALPEINAECHEAMEKLRLE